MYKFSLSHEIIFNIIKQYICENLLVCSLSKAKLAFYIIIYIK